MVWHKDMACGVHLGILLMCLVQAEHVRCLWAAEAQSSQTQSGNRYVGFSQQDSGLKRFSGSYPQNQLRQASAQSSSFSTDAAVGGSRGYTQTLSQPAQSGYPSLKVVQSSLLSNSNSRPAKAQEVPKKKFTGLSAAIASGSSVSKYSKKQSDLTDISKKSTWPVLQGTLRASKYPSSSSVSVPSPSSKSKLASHQLAQKAPSAAETQAYYGQKAAPMKSSSLFNPVSPEQQKSSVRVKTSATARATRVSSSRGAKASKPSRFSAPQNERRRNNPSQKEAGNPYRANLFPATGGNSKESYKPTSTSKQNSRLGFQPRGLQTPTNQRLSYKPSYTSNEPIPSGTNSVQASWNSRNSAQGVSGNLAASGSSRAGAPAQKFAPTRTHNIPQRFGGFTIRRLKEPADEPQVSIRKPQQTYTAPSQQNLNIRKPQQAYVAPSQQNFDVRKPQKTYTALSQQSLDVRKPQQTYVAPSQQNFDIRKPQQTYVTPSQQRLDVRKPQQTYTALSQQSLDVRKPQQTYVAPSQQNFDIRKPQPTYTAPSQQNLNIRKPQQTYTAPSQQNFDIRKPQQTYVAPSQQNFDVRKPQQTYTAPSQQSASLQPQAQSVHPQSTWKRIKPFMKIAGAAETSEELLFQK